MATTDTRETLARDIVALLYWQWRFARNDARLEERHPSGRNLFGLRMIECTFGDAFDQAYNLLYSRGGGHGKFANRDYQEAE